MTAIDPRISARFKRDTGMDLEPGLIMLCYVGSIAHGTHVPKTDPDAVDDIDLMGVFIPPFEYTLGLGQWDHWTMKEGELDVVVYSLKKYVGMLLKSNPNVLGTLYNEDRHYLVRTPEFRALQAERGIFAAKTAYGAFIGYARAQLKKMLAPQRYEGYMGAKRKELVDRFGYDVKNAAHLIRLMRMCYEYLLEGTLHVDRTGIDAEQLKKIKRGEWAVEDVERVATILFADADAALGATTLPRFPNYARANALVEAAHLSRYHLYAPSHDTLDSLVREIKAWQRVAFPHCTAQSAANHLQLEAAELAANPIDPEEQADIFLLLVANATCAGTDLVAAIRAKLEKNKRRTWGKPREDGVVLHTAEGDDHATHGRGSDNDGPHEPDCPCRGSESEAACAASGCGFCRPADV